MTEITLKMILTSLVLILIYRLEDRKHIVEYQIFKSLPWYLIHAYKVFVPVLTLYYFANIIKIFEPNPIFYKMVIFQIAFICIPIILAFVLFYIIIKRPFLVNWNDFGINVKCFFRKALPVAIASIIILTLLINPLLREKSFVSILSFPVALFMIIAILGSITEELLIRGILWRAFTRKMNIFFAAFASSVCWGMIHYDYPLWRQCVVALIGLFLAWTYYKTRTILVPMVIHSAMNILFLLAYILNRNN